jgi:hypothetical protein
MQEALDGSHVTWMEHVTDEQYDVAPEASGGLINPILLACDPAQE